MKDLAQRISEAIGDSVASKQAEVAALLDKMREDIVALERALNADRHLATGRREANGASRRRSKATEGGAGGRRRAGGAAEGVGDGQSA